MKLFLATWNNLTSCTAYDWNDMKLMLKELRNAAGYDQREMAERLGIPWRTYGAWERGESTINLRQACLICDVLGCTPNDLVGIRQPDTRKDESDLMENYRSCDAESRAGLLVMARNGAIAANRKRVG